MNPGQISVSIIIVSYNTCELLRDCLRSVYEKTRDLSFEVIVSDNGSQDGSVEMLKAEFPQVVLVENRENLGFGTANNRGLDVAKGKYVLYLNSDTLLLNNAVKEFVDYWESRPAENLGALGCNLVDANRERTESCGNFPESLSQIQKALHHFLAFYCKNVLKCLGRDISGIRKKPVYEKKAGAVDYVVGADLFVKNDEAARYDEKFFLYFEETDLQWRMQKKGLERRIIDGPQIQHLIRGGRGKADDVIRYGSFSMVQSEISRVRYAKKNLSFPVAWILKFLISLQWLSPYIFQGTKKYFRTLWRV